MLSILDAFSLLLGGISSAQCTGKSTSGIVNMDIENGVLTVRTTPTRLD